MKLYICVVLVACLGFGLGWQAVITPVLEDLAQGVSVARSR